MSTEQAPEVSDLAIETITEAVVGEAQIRHK